MIKISESLIPAESRERLRGVSRALQRLHKSLLDNERVQFERVRGRIESSGEFLQLVLHDEWFAYLRPLSALVAQIDELLHAEEATREEAGAVIAQARTMLKPSETGNEFARRYDAAIQRDPDVIFAQREVMRLLTAYV
jgi:nucleotide-binding universal stress UspA family protein